MNIRNAVRLQGHEVSGKLRYCGKWNLSCRYYMDEAGTIYIVDSIAEYIQVIQNKK